MCQSAFLFSMSGPFFLLNVFTALKGSHYYILFGIGSVRVFWWKYGIWGCKYAVWCDIWQVWGVSTDPNRLTLSDAGQLVLLPTHTFTRTCSLRHI